MATGRDQANFAINLEGNAGDVAKSTASAMQALRDRVTASAASLKEMNASLRNLKGASAELTPVKEELKAKIKAEQQALAAATAEQLKAQKATRNLVKADKDLMAVKDAAKKKQDASNSAISAAGGPLGALLDRTNTLKTVFGEGAGSVGVFALGLTLFVGAVTAVTAAIGEAVYGFGKFVATSRDAARSAALLREAAFGANPQWGQNFGEQVVALGREVPTSRAELDKLGISLRRQNIGGQLLVDSMHAIAHASAALGDEAGNKLKGFIERGMILGRPGLFRVNAQDLIGSGLEIDEFAASLAETMHVGVKQARRALMVEGVKLADGAAAMRVAVEKKFGGLNLRQMLSLENLTKKLHESLADITSGVNIEPLLDGFKRFVALFDSTTQTGNALKQIVTVFGGDMVKAFSDSVPAMQAFIDDLVIGALRITVRYLQARNAIRDFIGPETMKQWNLFSVLLQSIENTASLIAKAFSQIATPGTDIFGTVGAMNDLRKVLTAGGGSAVDGLNTGLKAGEPSVAATVGGLGEVVKNAFRAALGIHSPSTVFSAFGEHTAAGFEQGVGRGSGAAQGAVGAMVAVPSASGGGGGRGVVVNVTINATGGGGGSVAEAVASPSVLDQLQKAISSALQSGAVPVAS